MMGSRPIEPLADISITPQIAALPKVDLHIHQEWPARLDRVLARREGRPSVDWYAWATGLMAKHSPGAGRLAHIGALTNVPQSEDMKAENFIARVEDLLDEAAADGAILVEVRLGGETILRPDMLTLFREAERRVQVRYPRLHAEAIATLLLWLEPERVERLVDACVNAVDDGLRGIDLLYQPYDTEADWTAAYRIAERAADAGLGVTAHAGEVSTANIAAALKTPGLTRIGHATHVVKDSYLLDLLVKSGVTVEASLSCNVVLGAAPSYEAHPIHQFAEYGIPFALCTDDPVRICTTLGREYQIAHMLGFSIDQLRDVTRNAIQAAFITPERQSELLASLDGK